MFFFSVGVFCALFYVQLSDKHETVLLDMCCNSAYLILGLEDKCVVNYHNNATHIYSVRMNDVMVDMHTLLSWPWKILFYNYDTQAVS